DRWSLGDPLRQRKRQRQRARAQEHPLLRRRHWRGAARTLRQNRKRRRARRLAKTTRGPEAVYDRTASVATNSSSRRAGSTQTFLSPKRSIHSARVASPSVACTASIAAGSNWRSVKSWRSIVRQNFAQKSDSSAATVRKP